MRPFFNVQFSQDVRDKTSVGLALDHPASPERKGSSVFDPSALVVYAYGFAFHWENDVSIPEHAVHVGDVPE